MAKAFKLLLTLVGGALETYGARSTKCQHRLRRHVVVLLRSLTTFFLASSILCLAQQDGQDTNQTPPPILPRQPSKPFETEAPSFTFNAVTSMVIVDLVARDKEDNPVRDLTAGDLHVSESIGESAPIPEKIASFEPVTEAVRQRAARTSGIVLGWLHPSFCPLTGAYELSYYLSLESRKDGLHHISVTSSRPGLRLFFRPGYKIEANKAVAASAEELADQKTNRQLQKQPGLQGDREQHRELELPRIACYDTLNTTTFPLDLHKVNTDTKINAAYEFVVPGSYFASLPAPDRDRPTQLDYSLCTFQLLAHPLHHFDGTVQVGRNPQDYQLIRT